MDLKDRIKKAREYLDIGSQEEFAKKIKIPLSRVKDLERGKVNALKAEEAVKIEEIFSLNGWWLLTGKGDMLQTPIEPVNTEGTYSIQKLTCKVSASGGNNIRDIDVFDSGEMLHIDRALFKTQPSNKIRAIQVDGYSMVPMLFPDSWVIFENGGKWSGDGLYVLNWRGELMVKLLQVDPRGMLHIISINKDYQSWEADLEDDQSTFYIVGKVIRSVI